MGRRVAAALYLLVMIVIVVAVDVLFLRHHFLERLIANVGIVLVFALVFLGLQYDLVAKAKGLRR